VTDPALAAGFARAWALLGAAPGDPSSGLRLPVVVTVRHGEPDARVMVLRAVDRASHTLQFYSDTRAAKITTLASTPRIAVTGYDTANRLQLRLGGLASIITDTGADAAWSALTATGRTAYQSLEPPGTPVAELPHPSEIPADSGRRHFAIVAIMLDRFEWLDLAVPGHRRALHLRDGADWRGSWLVP